MPRPIPNPGNELGRTIKNYVKEDSQRSLKRLPLGYKTLLRVISAPPGSFELTQSSVAKIKAFLHLPELEILARFRQVPEHRERPAELAQSGSAEERGVNIWIAVLAFDNPSNDAELTTFADGIADGIITKLSSLPEVSVISRATSFSYRDQQIGPKAIGRELRVHYLLTGHMSRGKERMRVSAQLVDAQDGRHLWGKWYDRYFHRRVSDVHAIEDEITDRIVEEIGIHLRPGYLKEQARMSRNMDAWESLSRAQVLIDKRTKADLALAAELARHAIEKDAQSAMAHALLSYVTMLRLHYGWEKRDIAAKTGLEHARLAIEINPNEPWGQIAHGFVRLHVKPVSVAADCFQRAIELNPNLAFAYTGHGAALCYLGEGEQALRQVDVAEKLSPPTRYARGDLGTNSNVRSSACFILKRYGQGIEFAEKAKKENPGVLSAYRNLVVNCALAGKIASAKDALKELADRQQIPLSLHLIAEWLPYVRESDRKRYLDGFRLAGLK